MHYQLHLITGVNFGGTKIMVIKRFHTNGRVTHVKIIYSRELQKFSMRLIEMGTKEGWLRLRDGDIIINSEPRKTVYRIIQYPGACCCFCNLALPEGGLKAKAHVDECHQGHESPDKSNPAGYGYNNFYQCIKEPN